MSILRGTSIVGLLTLASRVLGFFRDLLIALLFGASGLSDAYFVAFRIPNLLRSIFAEGALTSAFVPTFASEGKKGLPDAQRALASIASALLFSTVTVSLIGILIAPTIVNLIAPGFEDRPDQYQLCVDLTRIMMPYICFVSLVALLNGTLNYYLVFGASAFAQVLMNLVLIVAAALALGSTSAESATYLLAWSVLIGGAVQVLAQIPALKKVGLSLSFSRTLWTPAVKSTVVLMLPAILGSAVYQITIFLNTVFASLLEKGSISWLFYADRVTQLPLGIFSIALASVLLPMLSRAQAEEDTSTFSKHLIDSLRFTSFVILPLAGLLYSFGEPLIALLFERGEFSHKATVRTAEAVRYFALGLWSVSCYSMLTRAYIAQKDTVTPSLGGGLMLLFSVILSILFMGEPVSGGDTFAYLLVTNVRGLIPPMLLASLGHGGLALASTIASLLTFIMLLLLFHKRNTVTQWGLFVSSTARALVSTLVAAFLVSLMPPSSLLSLFLSLVAYSALYLFCTWALFSREFKETFLLLQRLLNRFSGRTQAPS